MKGISRHSASLKRFVLRAQLEINTRFLSILHPTMAGVIDDVQRARADMVTEKSRKHLLKLHFGIGLCCRLDLIFVDLEMVYVLKYRAEFTDLDTPSLATTRQNKHHSCEGSSAAGNGVFGRSQWETRLNSLPGQL